MIGPEARTLVVGHQVVEIELETDDRPHSTGLLIRVDGDKRWSSEEPGWRDIGCGVDGDILVWSARRLLAVPLQLGTEVNVVDCDEDIIAVFRVLSLWLLVCESSLRLASEGGELSDVVSEARWDQDVLLVGCGDGAYVRVVAVADQLKVLPAA